MGDTLKTVTFGVIAYNEHRYLPDLLNDLLKQTYPKELVEVILVDGESTDDTWQIMQSFQEKHVNEYLDIKLLKNSKRIQPAGWNVVIKNSTADMLLRIDAHARIPEDFIEKNVSCISSGEFVCGGPRENIIDEDTPWKQLLLDAEQSMFGSGIASYRNETIGRKYVKSVFHGAYRREVIEKVGLFNEKLVRTEDNEYHYRVREASYQICYDPLIKSSYQTRSSLKGMINQKYLNGLWIGRTLFVCPGCISLFHVIPLLFVLAIIFTTLLGGFGHNALSIMLWIIYGVTNVLISIGTAMKAKNFNIFYCILPILFLLLHVSYGIGTLVGIVQGILKQN